jgi:hypothetical protein
MLSASTTLERVGPLLEGRRRSPQTGQSARRHHTMAGFAPFGMSYTSTPVTVCLG